MIRKFKNKKDAILWLESKIRHSLINANEDKKVEIEVSLSKLKLSRDWYAKISTEYRIK